jgi:hypothetical protein
MVNAMFEFPPAQDMLVYREWQARINELLEYAQQCLKPALSRSLSHQGPVIGPTNVPASGPTQHVLPPAP